MQSKSQKAGISDASGAPVVSDAWFVSGPDEFGDFHFSSNGEPLAKCVVIQNGFRTAAETKMIAAFVHIAVNSHDALVRALEEIQDGLADTGSGRARGERMTSITKADAHRIAAAALSPALASAREVQS